MQQQPAEANNGDVCLLRSAALRAAYARCVGGAFGFVALLRPLALFSSSFVLGL